MGGTTEYCDIGVGEKKKSRSKGMEDEEGTIGGWRTNRKYGQWIRIDDRDSLYSSPPFTCTLFSSFLIGRWITSFFFISLSIGFDFSSSTSSDWFKSNSNCCWSRRWYDNGNGNGNENGNGNGN